jgi:hypothetical protein
MSSANNGGVEVRKLTSYCDNPPLPNDVKTWQHTWYRWCECWTGLTLRRSNRSSKKGSLSVCFIASVVLRSMVRYAAWEINFIHTMSHKCVYECVYIYIRTYEHELEKYHFKYELMYYHFKYELMYPEPELDDQDTRDIILPLQIDGRSSWFRPVLVAVLDTYNPKNSSSSGSGPSKSNWQVCWHMLSYADACWRTLTLTLPLHN